MRPTTRMTASDTEANDPKDPSVQIASPYLLLRRNAWVFASNAMLAENSAG